MGEERPVMRIGTRKSDLALAQTRLFVEACLAVDAHIRYEIVEMSTMGDRIQNRPLYEFEGKGMFVSVFEEALSAGKIDAAVHSGKDMPVCMPEDLTVGAVLRRGDPGDVLVTLTGKRLKEDAVIGTTSLRRRQQVEAYLGYRTKPVRGNVMTRLEKLRSGEVDGLILAAAGLERLSILPRCQSGTVREDEVFSFRKLDERDIMPAAAQGIIAAQCRRDSPFRELLEQVNDRDTMYCFRAERAYLRAIGAGCQQPVAAYSRCSNGIIHMDAAYWTENGYSRVSGADRAVRCEALGEELAGQILSGISLHTIRNEQIP